MSLPTVQDILPGFPGWATLELSFGDQISGQGSGETLVKQLRPALWLLHAASRTLSPNELRKWKAILDGLDNGGRLFKGYDFAAFYPVQYPNGTWPTGGSFSGVCSVNGVGGDGVSLSLAGLPPAFAGSIGDMIAITNSTGSPAAQCLVRAVESFTADGSGVTADFEVRGDIPAWVLSGLAAAVKQPFCHMRIVPGSISAPKDSSARGAISFDAIQVPTP